MCNLLHIVYPSVSEAVNSPFVSSTVPFCGWMFLGTGDTVLTSLVTRWSSTGAARPQRQTNDSRSPWLPLLSVSAAASCLQTGVTHTAGLWSLHAVTSLFSSSERENGPGVNRIWLRQPVSMKLVCKGSDTVTCCFISVLFSYLAWPVKNIKFSLYFLDIFLMEAFMIHGAPLSKLMRVLYCGFIY